MCKKHRELAWDTSNINFSLSNSEIEIFLESLWICKTISSIESRQGVTKLRARKKSVKSSSSIITTLCTSHPKIASGKWTDNSCPFLYLPFKCCWERSIGASLGHNAWYQGPGVWRPDALFRFIFYFYWNNNESVHKWSGTPICTFQCYQIGNRRCPAKIWHTLWCWTM